MIKLRVAAFSVMARLAPVLALLFGCATAAPPDLLSARAAYLHAEGSLAARAVPAELHKARVALDEAEASFAAHPGDEATRDLAYVAERKALTAEALGSTNIADGQKQGSEAAFQKKQGQMLDSARKDLGRSKEQLAEAARDQAKTSSELNVERGARADADSKAALSEQKAVVASDALAKLAAKEEQRGMVITLSGSVLFRTGQATLLPGAETRLNDVAVALVGAKERTVLVEGHTDSRGSSDGNMALSQRRADAVRSYLVLRGYPAEKIVAHGVGQGRPVAENATAEGRANNRRVEIVVQREGHSSLP
jgi:outer membrane protein OmpA-like peptidoglycan-associated protein